MGKNVFILSIGLIILTGCGDYNNGMLQEANAYEAGTVFILTNVKIFQFPHSTCRTIRQHALCGKENLIVSEYNSSENWTETAPSISEEISFSEEPIVELPSYLYKMSVFFDERGNLVLDNDGYCYQYR